jgi:ABC-2 type transport system ATP-binding protein
MIAVRDLSKHYRVQTRSPGALAALRSIVRRDYETVRAVDGVSFEVASGERVGLLGSNGAGKTTTLKVLSGLLHPTAGVVRVAGFEPRLREHRFLHSISLVLGQRQRLLWDLPPAETFELNRVIYGVPDAQFRESLRELDTLLELGDLVRRPTRELSLGERMKCELAAALLHRPKVLFLDEPTIGLDVAMQVAVRAFVQRYNERQGATLVLTSHSMDDVIALCPRVLVVNRGKLVYDGALDALARKLRPEKQVVLRLDRAATSEELAAFGAVVGRNPLEVTLRVDPARIKEVLSGALLRLPVRDLTVEDPPLEEVLAELFTGAATTPGGEAP